MIHRSMNWNPKAYRALIRAFAGMPPEIKERVLQKVVSKIEEYARDRGDNLVDFNHVYEASCELLRGKERYMYEALVESLKMEGYKVSEERI